MSNLILSTGITPSYLERAQPYLASVRKHCLGIDFRPVIWDPGSTKTRRQWPKFMLQQGMFMDFPEFKNVADDTVIIFTDADAVFQRGLFASEMELFLSVQPYEFLVGYNQRDHWQTLGDEAMKLRPKDGITHADIEDRFTGYKIMLCGNTGFVVARADSWAWLNNVTCEDYDDAHKCFHDAALVQFIMCYRMQLEQRPFSWHHGGSMRSLPLTIHAHGHVGAHDGVWKREDGIWMCGQTVIAFAHAL